MSAQKSNGVAAILSLVIPGAGHMYKDKVGEGLAWFAFVLFGYALMVVPGLVLHFICVINAASTDPEPLSNVTEIVPISNTEKSDSHNQFSKNYADNFVSEIGKSHELLKKGLLNDDEYLLQKKNSISWFVTSLKKPNKNDFLLALIPLLESGALNKDDLELLKSSYSFQSAS